ncbi:hypothetical protein SDC9_61690 [bioreactor metagenome]|uniref:Amino acid transporter transmembrane domain-containing protein n=1 Tax=bioreactor metagenome TaxID=1076179 RepID=A0A644XGG9_9ZZZZ
MSKFLKAVFQQFSGIVGAGIFALPFIFYYSNFYLAIGLVVAVAVIMFILNNFYATIICHTAQDHQLPGYAHKYLGSKAKLISLFGLLFSCFGILLAYVKLAATFIHLSLPQLPFLSAAILFIILISGLHLSKFNFSKNIIQFIPVINLIVILVIFLNSKIFSPVNFNQISPNIIYFGGIIFALTGFTIIPEVEETLRSLKNKKFFLRLASGIGLVLAIMVYFLFTYSVIRIGSGNVSSDAVTHIFNQHPISGYLLIFFGITTILRSSLNFLLIIKEIFYRDLNISSSISYFISILFFFSTLLLINLPFIKVISFVGLISTFISASIICLIRQKISKNIFTIFGTFLILSILSTGIILQYLF